MELLKANTENIRKAAMLIKSGGLAAFPTETVYGLGADGLNSIAVAKIFEAKNRPSFNPLILHIAEKEQIENVCHWENPKVEKLIEEFWPGPLTLVLYKNDIVPEIVTAGNPGVAVRMPNHPVALELIRTAGTPIAAPSANAFGQLSPTEASHVINQLGENVDIILDGGKCPVGVESTILQIENDEIYLLRHGGLSIEELEKTAGRILIKKSDEQYPNSPGQLLQHYAPKTPLKFLSGEVLEKFKDKNIGAMFFCEKLIDYNFTAVEILSASGNYREAAANFFSSLHKLEQQNLDLIVAEPVEEVGLGRAIMDRLRKAGYKYRDI